MEKSLVIVESPAKAKTINKYLGKDYTVKSSVGHIRDLAKGSSTGGRKKGQESGGRLLSRMGVDPESDWQARYEVIPGKEKVAEELRRLAKKAAYIYLATDLDREGEAIAWHLQQVMGGDPARYRRVVFNEITRKAITEAFERPGEVNMARVEAQQTRRFLDRVVGFLGSSLLSKKVARRLSMGRVQSVAVRLLVEREREIRAFAPEEYWELFARLAGEKGSLKMQVEKQAGKPFKARGKEEAEAAMTLLRAAEFRVSERQSRETKTQPRPPFITSTLQRDASTRLGFGVKKTMSIAQQLYEAGYITYMRTDSTNLSGEAVNECRDLIRSSYGDEYLPEKPRFYASGQSAQEAHEAIRPSDVKLLPGSLPHLKAEQRRLYDLIWRRFLACQMPPAKYLSTTLTVTAGDFELKARGRILLFDGFTRVQPAKDEDRILPDYRVRDLLSCSELEPVQHFTKPPARYNEASLVSELEKRGIGRPSTYASIISTIQERGYVSLKNKRLYAEKIGEVVTDRLVENFDDLMDYGFTAELEGELDQISSGETGWKSVLNVFYTDFSGQLKKAEAEEGGMRPNLPVPTEVSCPKCGRPMNIRTAASGVFLGCSGYSTGSSKKDKDENQCRQTLPLTPGNEAASAGEGGESEDSEKEARLLLERERCPKCDTVMDSYLVDETRKLHVCGNNPDCSGSRVEQGQFRIKGYEGPTLSCDRCEAGMQLKNGRFGKYFGCTNPECKNTRKLLRSGQPAPPRADPIPMPELKCAKVEDHYVLRDGAAGIFLAASQFPKKRETRPPFVDELIPHQNEVDPKHQYLLQAPLKDPAGNRSQIRYSRKSREQYVMTEANGKPTGWTARYVDGRWVEAATKPKTKAKAKTKKPGSRKTKAKPKTGTKRTIRAGSKARARASKAKAPA